MYYNPEKLTLNREPIEVKRTTKKEAMEYLLKDAEKNASSKLELNKQYGLQVSEHITVTVEDINRNKRLFYLISWILNNSRNGKMPNISKIVDSSLNDLIGFVVTDNPDNMEWINNLMKDYADLMNDKTGDDDIGIKINNIGEIK